MRYKIASIIAFLFIISALAVVALRPPAAGYELSIYEAYPIYFWIFLVAGFACGIYIMISQAFSEGRTGIWVIGFCAILLVHLILIMLPVFRGYPIYGRQDELSNLGDVNALLLNSHFGQGNYYPILQVLGASIHHITLLELGRVSILVAVFSYFLFAISLYLLSKTLCEDKRQSLLVTAFGVLLLYGQGQHQAFTPSTLAFYFYPLMLFMFLKTRTAKGSVYYITPFLLFLLLMPLIHPVESWFLTFAFIIMAMSFWVYSTFHRRRGLSLENCLRFSVDDFIIPCVILSIVSITWFSSFSSTYASSIIRIRDWVLYFAGQSYFAEQVVVIEYANLPIFEIIMTFLKMHGHHLILFGIASILTLIIWKNLVFSPRKSGFTEFAFSNLFIVFTLLSFLFYFSNFVLGYGRILKFAIFAVTLLLGVGTYKFFSGAGQKWMKNVATVGITTLLVVCMLGGLINMYYSPLVRKLNDQVTRMDLIGMSWVLKYRDARFLIDDIEVVQRRFADYFLGSETPLLNVRMASQVAWPSEHFGFPEYEAYGQLYEGDRYFLMDKASELRYPGVFPEYPHHWSFTPDDFIRLSRDPTVDKIYSNGEFRAFYVNAQPR